MKQISVLTENKPGILADIALLLGNSGINIESISAETSADTSVIRLMTNDERTASELLEKSGYKVIESRVVLVSTEDKPGQLGRVAKRLANEGINIESIYLLSKRGDRHIFAMKLDNETKAKQVLGKEHILEKY